VPRPASQQLDTLLAVTLALAVAGMSLGSTTVNQFRAVGSSVRWILLAVFVLVALIAAASRSRRVIPAPAVLLPAFALALLGLVSAAWSVDSRLTIERALSFTLLLTGVVALAVAVAGRREAVEKMLLGVLAGTVAVAVAGLVVLAFNRSLALQPGFPGTASRFRGFGENPNTVPILISIAFPAAVWALIHARTRATRAGAALVLLLLYGSVVASGSNGGLLGVIVGLVVLVVAAPLRRTRRVTLALATGVAFVAGVAIAPTGAPSTTTVAAPPPTQTASKPGTGRPKPPKLVPSTPPPSVPGAARLEDEIGAPSSASQAPTRHPFSGSGRIAAWWQAYDQGRERPLLGYGFGTEQWVFIDRLYNFQSYRPENSVVGMFLQLGAFGALMLVAVGLACVVTALRVLRRLHGRDRGIAAVCAASLAAGMLLALVQSYVYSVGNVGTMPFWVFVGLLAGLTVVGKVRVGDGQQPL
jgi:O-antigen ligase